jgi:hypothetical protein
MIWRFLAVASLIMLGAGVAHSQEGTEGTVSSVYYLGDKPIPLPQGTWQIVTTENAHSRANNSNARAYLADVQHGVLSRWIYVATNTEYNRNGWKRNKNICDRTNVHFAYSSSPNNKNDSECWIVNHWGMTMGKRPSQATIDFYRWSDSMGRPNTAVGVAYYLAKHGDFITLELEYNPVVDGFPDTPTAEWRGNPWHPDLASKDPKKLAYLRALKALGERYFDELRVVLH